MMYGALKWAMGRQTTENIKRCCEECARALDARKSARPIAEAVLLAGDAGFLDIVAWRKCSCLSTEWRDAMRTILSVWEEVQNMRPYSNMQPAHARLLKINAARMHGHLTWSVLAASCGVFVLMRVKLDDADWSSTPCCVLGCHEECGHVPSTLADGMMFLCGDMSAVQRILRSQSVLPLMALTNTLSSYCAVHPNAFEALVIPMVSSSATGASELAHALFFGVWARDRELAGGALLRVPDRSWPSGGARSC